MPRNPKLDPQALWEQTRILLRQGPQASKPLLQHLRISQPALSRLLKAHSNELFVAGKTKNAIYALKRPLEGLPQQIPVYAIDPKGNSSQRGELISVFPGFYWKSEAGDESGFYPDLPYFVEDMRPSGFLGRMLPHLHPELGAPEDITQWSSGQSLRYITQFGWDLIGNLIVGEPAFQVYLQHLQKTPAPTPLKERAKTYSTWAENVMKLGDPGSSAGGEQPKFLSTRHPHTPVIVKFSPKRESAVATRRADLLWCEFQAKEILRKYGIAASASEMIEGGNRAFLETVRFDRVVHPRKTGRRGVISMLALDLEFVGRGSDWVSVGRALFEQKKISRELLNRIEWLELFGKLIGNTDMHLGNVSFFVEDGKILDLTPVYDMLPMLYYARDELIEREFIPPLPSPAAAERWRSVLPAAIAFWEIVSEHSKISQDFRKIAVRNCKKLRTLGPLVDALPR